MKATSNGAVIVGIVAAGILIGVLAALVLAERIAVSRRRLVFGCVVAAIALAAVLYWSLLGYDTVAARALSPSQ